MKILNAVAKVVAVIAQVASVVALAMGNPALAAALQTVAAVAGAVAAVTSFFVKPPDPGGGFNSDWRADPQAGIDYVIGRTATGGKIAHHDSFGSDNKYVGFVTVLSYGPIQEYEALQVDKVNVAFSANNAVGHYHDHMWLDTQLGTVPESTALAPTNGALPGWGASSKLSGLAADLWELKYDVKGSVNYKNGIPKPLRILKGVKVYDPRLDSTFPGGSGACRALDETTYVYSENPWLHLITWALGRWQQGKKVLGVGMPAAALAMSSFAEAATIAETNGWTCGGVITSTDDKWDRMKAMAQAGGGVPIRLGAQLSCLVNAPRVSLATVTRDDLAGEVRIVGTTPRRQRMNGIVPRYRSEAHDWEVVPAAEVRVAGYVTDDGGERTRELDLVLVQDVDQAAQLARYEIENNRERGPITLPLKPKWLGYKPGDCITVDLPDQGLAAQTCIIRNRTFDPASGIVTLELMTETSAKHTAALGSSGTAPPPVDTTPPDTSIVTAPQPGSWTLAATSITAGGVTQPALVITGAVDNDTADGVVFEYRVNGTTTWIPAGTELPTITRKEILGVNPGTNYDVAVSYTNRTSVSNRLVLTMGTTPGAPYAPSGGVTGGTTADSTFTLTYTGTPGAASGPRYASKITGVPGNNHLLGNWELSAATPTAGFKVGGRLSFKTVGTWTDSNAGSWFAVELVPSGSTTVANAMALSPVEVNFGMGSAFSVKINNLVVLKDRKTGWATPTGTATRSAFDTATVTTAQLAERVKALIDDLHVTAGHGLIGT